MLWAHKKYQRKGSTKINVKIFAFACSMRLQGRRNGAKRGKMSGYV
jgi:hypothetical protein